MWCCNALVTFVLVIIFIVKQKEKCFDKWHVDKWQFFVSILCWLIVWISLMLWLWWTVYMTSVDLVGPGTSLNPPSRSESQEKCIIFNNKPFLYGHVTLSLLDLFIVTKMFWENQELAAKSCQRNRQTELNGVAGCSINLL